MEEDKRSAFQKRLDGWKESLKNNYRVVVSNDETLEEVYTNDLTLLNVYVLASTVIVSTAALVLALIMFTPVKKYIPGYGDFNSSTEAIKMNRQIDAMEKELRAQRIYTENFRKILVGDVEPPKEEDYKEEVFSDSALNVKRIEEDEQLRQEVELDEIREMSRSGKGGRPEIVQPRLEQIHFTSPLSGQVSAGFAVEKKHYGIDISAPKNTPIKTVLDGIVISSDWTLETGNTIAVQHPNNLISFYKHNSKLLKNIGDVVTAGEAIAIIGNTGTLTDGPHLHFELWFRGKPVNPTDYILL